jgi:hypothetical protein
MNGICSAAVAFCEPICLNCPPSSVAAFCAPSAAASKYGLLIALGMNTTLRSAAAADGDAPVAALADALSTGAADAAADGAVVAPPPPQAATANAAARLSAAMGRTRSVIT